MRGRFLFVAAVLFGLWTSAAFADDTPSNGVQTALPFHKVVPPCKSSVSVRDLRTHYFSDTAKLVADFNAILGECKNEILTSKEDPNGVEDVWVIFILMTHPTDADGADPIIVHYIGHVVSSERPPGTVTLPGIAKATWVYVTDKKDDEVVGTIVSTPSVNPAVAQIGPLVAKLVPLAGGGKSTDRKTLTPQAASKPHELYLSVAKDVQLPFRRATITENEYVKTAIEKDHKASSTQVPGTETLLNVPRSWYTFDAAAGVVTGKVKGAQQATVAAVSANGNTGTSVYQTDPLSRAAALAGVTLHAPYDSTTPKATPKERLGLSIAGVITPAAGIAVGGSYGTRGIAFNVWYAWMFVSTTPSNKVIGDVVDQNANPQLVTGTARAWIIGASYTFGGS